MRFDDPEADEARRAGGGDRPAEIERAGPQRRQRFAALFDTHAGDPEDVAQRRDGGDRRRRQQEGERDGDHKASPAARGAWPARPAAAR